MNNKNAERNKQIIALYKAGASTDQLAAYLGVEKQSARSIVAAVVHRAGAASRRADHLARKERYSASRPDQRPVGRPRGALPDIIGKVFGELTVIACAGRDKGGRALIRVKCSCGREKVRHRYNIVNGISLGCRHPAENSA